MSRKIDLTAKAAKIAAAAKARQVPAAEPVVAPATPSGRTIRLSVDVTPEQYAWLDQWGLSAGAECGMARVPKQRLVRALIALAADDPAVCQQAIEQVKNRP